jgi:cyclin B/cyclin A
MDHFYKNLDITVEIQDIHSTGVTCMFIASKYEEIYPIRIKTVQNKIAHNKINAFQIKEKET